MRSSFIEAIANKPNRIDKALLQALLLRQMIAFLLPFSSFIEAH
jgi:hypothetical protein